MIGIGLELPEVDEQLPTNLIIELRSSESARLVFEQ